MLQRYEHKPRWWGGGQWDLSAALEKHGKVFSGIVVYGEICVAGAIQIKMDY